MEEPSEEQLKEIDEWMNWRDTVDSLKDEEEEEDDSQQDIVEWINKQGSVNAEL